MDISEKNLEQSIEAVLLAGGPDAYLEGTRAVAEFPEYSQKSEHSLDMVLFLNGIPIFTAELKNPCTG